MNILMKRAIVIFLIFIGAESTLFAQDLRLHRRISDSCRLPRLNATSSEPSVPVPYIVDSKKKWDALIASIPKQTWSKNPDDMPADRTIDHEMPNFDTTILVVVVLGPSNVGPLRFESATVKNSVLELKTSQWNRGAVNQPNDVGDFFGFVFPKVKGVTKIVHSTSEYTRKEYRTLAEDENSGKEGTPGKYGIRSNLRKGWVVPPTYDHSFGFNEWDVAYVAKPQEGIVLIDWNGKTIYRAFVYDNGPDYLVEGLARYRDASDRVGFVDIKGKIVIPAQFQFAGTFQMGVAEVLRNATLQKDHEHSRYVGGEVNTIDTTGKLLGKWRKAK